MYVPFYWCWNMKQPLVDLGIAENREKKGIEDEWLPFSYIKEDYRKQPHIVHNFAKYNLCFKIDPSTSRYCNFKYTQNKESRSFRVNSLNSPKVYSHITALACDHLLTNIEGSKGMKSIDCKVSWQSTLMKIFLFNCHQKSNSWYTDYLQALEYMEKFLYAYLKRSLVLKSQ